MASIKAGDHGTVYELFIRDNGESVPLYGAVVNIVLRNGDRRIVKEAQIKDAASGTCEIALTREDLATTGRYIMQGIVKYPNDGDKDFASDTEEFRVGDRI